MTMEPHLIDCWSYEAALSFSHSDDVQPYDAFSLALAFINLHMASMIHIAQTAYRCHILNDVIGSHWLPKLEPELNSLFHSQVLLLVVFIQLSYGTIPTFMTFIVPRLSMTSSHKTTSIDLQCYQNDVEQFYNFLLRRRYSLLPKFYSMELLLLPTKELVLYLLLKSTLCNLYYWGGSTFSCWGTISCWSLLCGASTTFYWGNSTVFSLTNLNGQEILTA